MIGSGAAAAAAELGRFGADRVLAAMTRARMVVAAGVVMLLVALSVTSVVVYRRTLGLDPRDRETAEALRQQIVALDTERATLRAALETLVDRDPRLEGMPDTPVRVAVPTTLARSLVERVVAGVADRVTLELSNISVRRTGVAPWSAFRRLPRRSRFCTARKFQPWPW